MDNRFYSDFDLERTPGPETGRPHRPDEYRPAFAIDRDRIIHTDAFRRLQGKTQVFLAGEYDFYRTRLTHSIEVSQIGRSICTWLRRRPDSVLADDFFIDPDLVEAVCLAHDLGHPPFGHAGERSLHELMREHGGFEGNAQTLRLLTATIFSEGSVPRGMMPTRALLDGVLKYKTLWHEDRTAAHHFIYDDQAEALAFAHGNEPIPADRAPGKERNALKSIECQIMDWADDTAYSLNDVADGVNAGFLTVDRIERWAESQTLDETATQNLADLLNAIRRGRVEARANKKIGNFITAVSLQPVTGFLSDRTHRHAFALAVEPAARAESTLYKRLALDLIFRSPQLQQLDYKAHQVLGRLWSALDETYLGSSRSPRHRLLQERAEAAILAAETPALKARLVCDFLARQTDGAATRLCQRLYDPEFGSIVDLI